MDTAKCQSTSEHSTTTVSVAEYSSRSLDQISSPAGLRSMNTPAALYLANEMSPDMVMSDLNIYRPTTTSLPLWNGTQGINYSTSVLSNGNHHTPEQDSGVTTNDILRPKPGSSSSYDVFRSEDGNGFQLSPKTSFDSGNVSNHESPSSDDMDPEDEETNVPFPKRKRRTAVPDEKKDAKYWARRRKNNDAAKRSRDMRRKKLDLELKSARDAITENQKLKQEIDVLKAEINSLRRLLKDANTTLSLWIRARQTAEPNVQLPPMLRSANVSYVNFPVSTTS